MSSRSDKDMARLLNIMREQGGKDNPSLPEIGTMTSSNSCTIGELPLDDDDLLINSSLKGKLEKGDEVLVTQIMDQDVYVIICKVVDA